MRCKLHKLKTCKICHPPDLGIKIEEVIKIDEKIS